MTLSGCALIDGIKNEKNITPIPVNEKPAGPSPSFAMDQVGSAATAEAAKTISPATR